MLQIERDRERQNKRRKYRMEKEHRDEVRCDVKLVRKSYQLVTIRHVTFSAADTTNKVIHVTCGCSISVTSIVYYSIDILYYSTIYSTIL